MESQLSLAGEHNLKGMSHGNMTKVKSIFLFQRVVNCYASLSVRMDVTCVNNEINR